MPGEPCALSHQFNSSGWSEVTDLPKARTCFRFKDCSSSPPQGNADGHSHRGRKATDSKESILAGLQSHTIYTRQSSYFILKMGVGAAWSDPVTIQWSIQGGKEHRGIRGCSHGSSGSNRCPPLQQSVQSGNIFLLDGAFAHLNVFIGNMDKMKLTKIIIQCRNCTYLAGVQLYI
jgi:hypothetical protein